MPMILPSFYHDGERGFPRLVHPAIETQGQLIRAGLFIVKPTLGACRSKNDPEGHSHSSEHLLEDQVADRAITTAETRGSSS